MINKGKAEIRETGPGGGDKDHFSRVIAPGYAIPFKAFIVIMAVLAGMLV